MEGAMGFKVFNLNLGFTDVELKEAMGKSRTQNFLDQVNQVVNWEPIEQLLKKGYPLGDCLKGHPAHPPLVLMKAVLLEKWFNINSDPELENQINDRLSFKSFIGIPLSHAAPDHSLICKFRKRVPQHIMEAVHDEILRQFPRKGFSIAGGMAIDARLVKSSGRIKSNKELRKERAFRETEEGKKDKKGQPLKFRGDIESDWTIKDDEPFYGMKEHASIDIKSGLVLSVMTSKASEHDTGYFQAIAVKGIHGKKLPPKIYADKAYPSEINRSFLSINKIADGIMRKNYVNAKLTELEHKRNRMISKVRYIIEQYFGLTELQMRAGRARFTTLIKENWNRLCQALAFNIKRVILARPSKAQGAVV
jgi:IS5 family transposase